MKANHLLFTLIAIVMFLSMLACLNLDPPIFDVSSGASTPIPAQNWTPVVEPLPTTVFIP